MSTRTKDVKLGAVELWFIPVEMRVPLKFGAQVVEQVVCARTSVRVERLDGKNTPATGWGETPLSVAWVWPASPSVPLDPEAAAPQTQAPPPQELSYLEKEKAMLAFCERIATALPQCGLTGHAMEIGHDFIETELPRLLETFNAELPEGVGMPHLAALVCFSLFDIALHDAYAKAHGVGVYEIYTAEWMNRDLADFMDVAADARGRVTFTGKYPADYLVAPPADQRLPVWHLVGGLDAIAPEALTGDEPDDGYPVLLRDWIRADGLNCLKIKLRGNDAAWDYDRLVAIGRMAREEDVDWLTTDFNCTVQDPAYVNDILDRLRDEDPVTYQKILYVEQPFPYDLEAHRIDVRSVSARKPLFMDESAHDWRYVRLGRELGWTGVALKTCKTQTGALLSLCWAKAHGMTLMVQDLTNPMLAQIPHVLLAAHAGTIMGVESNGMQFYPEASAPEAAVHPGLYRRKDGVLDFSTLQGPGFGYRTEEIPRDLPPPKVHS
jgi:L-alanine-DL-glutamate epimerase-like enolase superfamily enzyme